MEQDVGVPICLSATGPKNLRAAGGLPDRVMLYVGVNPQSLRLAIDHVPPAAEEAGRDLGTLSTTLFGAEPETAAMPPPTEMPASSTANDTQDDSQDNSGTTVAVVPPSTRGS